MKKLILIFIFAISLTGCINVVKHIPLHQTTSIYQPTEFVACNCVGVWWNDTYTKKRRVEASWFKFTWLLWVVDLPCEVVADTLTLPIDIPQMYRVKNAKQKFGVSNTNDVNDINQICVPNNINFED